MESGKLPLYRLTRAGLLEIVTRFVDRPLREQRDHFFFVYFFIRAYSELLVKLIEREGKYFPSSLQSHLNSLLDPDMLLLGQINHVKQELLKMENRLKEQKEILKIAERAFASGKDYMDIIKGLDQRYPYGLNPLRRYSEVLEDGTEKQRAWEITLGTMNRLAFLWSPAQRMLKHYLKELESLKANGEKDYAILKSSFKDLKNMRFLKTSVVQVNIKKYH